MLILSLALVFQTFLTICYGNTQHNNLTNEWVVLVTVSEWYDELFQNWLLWYKRLDLSMKTVVIAEDSITYRRYHNQSDFDILYFDMEEVNVMAQHCIYRKVFISGRT